MAVHSQRLRSSSDSPFPAEPDHDAAAPRPPNPRGIHEYAKRAVSHAATVALLLLTLAVGYVAARQQAPEAPGMPRWTPVMVRALAAAGNVDDVVLVEGRFGLDTLPAGSKEVVFYRLTIPPGETLTALAGPSCGCPGWPVSGGVGAEAVQSGRYRLSFAAPIQVQRRGVATLEAIPAHVEVVLGPGDAAIYPEYTADAAISVVGDDPVQLVGVAIVGMESSGAPAPKLPPTVRGEELSRSTAADWEKLGTGAVAVTIRQVTLPAGTQIAPYEPIGLEAMWVERGKIMRYFFEPGATAPNGMPMVWIEGRGSPLLGIKPGMRYDLASSDDGPAELLVLIIEPAGVTAQTLSP